MSYTKPEIIKSFLPIFYISKLFGCNLYALPNPFRTTNINDPPKWINVLICAVHIAINFFIVLPLIKKWNTSNSVFNNEYAAESGFSGLVVIVFLGHTITYVITFANCIITILDTRNGAITREILSSMIKFDDEMLKIGMNIDVKHRTMSWSLGVAALLLQIPIIFLSVTMSSITNDSTIFFIIATFLGHTTNLCCILSYLATLWYILINLADRFGSINEYLRQRIESKQGVSRNNRHYFDDHTIFFNLSNNHRKLVGIVDEFCKCNTIQIICSIGIIFLSSFVSAFMSYLMIATRVNREPPSLTVYYCIRTVFHCFLLYKTVSIGSEIRRQRKTALSLLSKATSLELNKMTLMQLNQFRYQVEQSNTAVSCGMFTMDWTLMYTFGTALTTYMFLFMQFDSKFKLKQ